MSLSGLLFESPVACKPVVASFDGGRLSSDGGLLLAMEAERRIRLGAGWLGASRTGAMGRRSANQWSRC